MPREVINSNIRDFSQEYRTEQDSMTAQLDQLQMEPDEQEAFLARARELILVRERKAALVEREDELKSQMMDLLDNYGEPYGSEGQHRSLPFPNPIRGIARFVRQTKSSTSVNEAKAEAIARRKGLYARLFKPVMALDEAAVMVAVEEDLITDEELAEIFPRKVSYAFTVEKVK